MPEQLIMDEIRRRGQMALDLYRALQEDQKREREENRPFYYVPREYRPLHALAFLIGYEVC